MAEIGGANAVSATFGSSLEAFCLKLGTFDLDGAPHPHSFLNRKGPSISGLTFFHEPVYGINEIPKISPRPDPPPPAPVQIH